MSNIKANSYFHYRNFYLNGRKTNYNFLIDGEMSQAYLILYEDLKNKELKFYKKKFKKSNEKYIPDDWQEELKNYISTAGLTSNRANEIMTEAFFTAEGLNEFRDLLIDKIHEELDTGQLSLFHETNQSLEKVIMGLYNTLITRTENKTISKAYRRGTGQVYVKGPSATTLEGWVIEIVQGIVSPEKKSTNNTELKYIADFQVPGIGLEETKRGIIDNKSGNVLLDSNFHIGSFTVNLKKSIPQYLSYILADCVANIITGIINLDNKKIEQAKTIFFRELSWLIYPYLDDRLLGHTEKGEIFYFSSGKNIILGSEFIEGIAGLNKMYIKGDGGKSKATISSSITKKLLEMAGIYIDLDRMKGINTQLQLNLDQKAKDVLNYELENQYKRSTFLTYAKFDLWYGKKY